MPNECSDPQGAPWVRLQRTRIALDFVDLFENPNVTFMDDSANLGEAEAARIAVEQSGAERLLQCQDMLANPRPRQSQFACSNGKAVMGDDLDKNRHAGEAVHESLPIDHGW